MPNSDNSAASAERRGSEAPDFWARYQDNFARSLLGVAREYKRAVMARLQASPDFQMLRLSFESVVTTLSAGPLRASEIARRLDLSKQHASQLIADVQRAGLVEKHRDPNDSRARLIALTPLGARLVRQGVLAAAAVSSELAAHVGVRSMAAALRQSARLADRLGLQSAAQPRQHGSALAPAGVDGAGVIGEELLRLADQAQQHLLVLCRLRGFRDLKRSDAQVLVYLGPDGVSLRELARLNEMSTQGIGRVVRDLEARAYVERRVDPDDARSRRVWLTARGTELAVASVQAVDALQQQWEPLVGAAAFDEWQAVLGAVYWAVGDGPPARRPAHATPVQHSRKRSENMTQERRDKGIEMFNTVYCGDLPQPPEQGTDAFFDHMLETLFGSLWADETLSIRDRRLLLLGAIAAQGEDMTFSIQTRSALKREELSVAQVEAMLVFLTQYVGYPRASKMRMAVTRVLQEFAEGQDD